MTTLEILKNLLVDFFDADADKIAEETSLDSLGLDNLDKIELIMAVEDEFECEIADEEAEELETVGQLVQIIEQNK